ncbi:MAG: alpha-L-fucosidase [Gemmatimonadota bacterium]|nr:alpha-L-fucosidase [Gemmatimonadota bacterium]MDH5197353.1 alpha-L-fucosidase [Gemmatimonadota bacterium]
MCQSKIAREMSRRSFVAGAAAMLAAPLRPGGIRFQSPRPTPSLSQLAWQRDELALFVHFGVNTFTDREWGDGTEDPAIFDPTTLDARQWARAARAAGFRAMVLTAKHHDGFCLWPSRTTAHSVAASPWHGGRGDVVQEFVDACAAEELRAGLYCSPWDRNAPAYGDSPRYNDLYCDQLTELLTQYGEIAEVWFDGANGEGPNGKRQEYDWPRVFSLVRRLQPGAVMFSDAGPDVRWCGNERGVAGDPNWSTVNPAAVPHPGASGDAVTAMLQHGDPNGSVWRPAEADVSIRPGWFYHPAEDDRVRSVDNLVDLYFSSVGRNAKLLLNVPPTREGRLHATDVARLRGMHARLTALFAEDHAAEANVVWRRTGPRSAEAELDLGQAVTASVVRIEEDIALGQAVTRYVVSGSDGGPWRELSQGSTIGHAKLDRFEPVRVRRVRLAVEEAVGAVGIRVYG